MGSRCSGDVNLSDLTGPFLAVVVPAEPPLPPPNGTGSLPTWIQTQTHRQDPASLPTQHFVPAEQGDAKGQATEEPKASAVPRRGAEGSTCCASIILSGSNCMLCFSVL